MTMSPPSSDSQLHKMIEGVVRECASDRGRLMDIIQAVYRRYGHVSHESIRAISSALQMHTVEVEDMVSFYAFFDPDACRFHIRLSRTPISFIKGAAEVAQAFVRETQAPMGGTSPDRQFKLDWTNDIGMADQEPAALINGAVVTSLTPSAVSDLVERLRRGPENSPFEPLPDLGGDGIGRSLMNSGSVIFQPDGPSTDGATTGMKAAVLLTPEEVIQEIAKSKLRGRGGAGFPTALKWRLCRQSTGDERYVVCNADEGEPGTFKDRVLLTEVPDLVFDGMTVAGYALGAKHGLVYLRGEYAYLWQPLRRVLEDRRRRGLLGKSIYGQKDFDFDIRLQLGAGAYICGEESALIESLEGKRGVPRDRPPFPTERGYCDRPTAVDNVETFACVARIMEQGADWFARRGTTDSTGTKLLSVSGDCKRPGVYEVDFGVTLNELLDLVGASDIEFVQVGGPSGQSVAPKDFGRRIAFEDLSTGGSIMVFNSTRDVLDVALQFTRFFVEESCGWCAPCRVGTTLLQQGMEKILANRGTLADIANIEALAHTVTRMSRCGLGQTAANPILTTMCNFPHLYEARLQSVEFLPRVTLQEALQEASALRDRAGAETTNGFEGQE